MPPQQRCHIVTIPPHSRMSLSISNFISHPSSTLQGTSNSTLEWMYSSKVFELIYNMHPIERLRSVRKCCIITFWLSTLGRMSSICVWIFLSKCCPSMHGSSIRKPSLSHEFTQCSAHDNGLRLWLVHAC